MGVCVDGVVGLFMLLCYAMLGTISVLACNSLTPGFAFDPYFTS